MDAVKIGNRVYHASCYAELKKDGGNTPLRTATPDSVLGKRKAEVSPPSGIRGGTTYLMFYRRQQVILHPQNSSETLLADHVDTSDHAPKC